MGRGDHEDQTRRADVPGLQLRRSHLCLEVCQPGDDLDGDPCALGGEQDVDRTKIAGNRNRCLERDAPLPATRATKAAM